MLRRSLPERTAPALLRRAGRRQLCRRLALASGTCSLTLRAEFTLQQQAWSFAAVLTVRAAMASPGIDFVRSALPHARKVGAAARSGCQRCCLPPPLPATTSMAPLVTMPAAVCGSLSLAAGGSNEAGLGCSGGSRRRVVKGHGACKVGRHCMRQGAQRPNLASHACAHAVLACTSAPSDRRSRRAGAPIRSCPAAGTAASGMRAAIQHAACPHGGCRRCVAPR